MDSLNEMSVKIAKGKAVLFAGAGLSVGVGLPNWRELTYELANEIGCSTNVNLIDIAQYYENEKGRHALYEKLRSQIYAKPVSLTKNHKMIASLGFRVVITTNYDTLLEEALRSNGLRIHVIVNDIDVSYWDEDEEVQVLKLHGNIETADSIVITRTDYSSFFRKHPGITHRLRAILLDRPLIFIGYSLEDPDFNFILDEITFDLKGHRPPSYFVGFNVDKFKEKDLEQRGIRVINIAVDEGAIRNNIQQAHNQALGELLGQVLEKVQLKKSEATVSETVDVRQYSVANEVGDLLLAMGYKISEIESVGSRKWFLAEKISEGKCIKRLTLCSDYDLGTGDVDAMIEKIETDIETDGWLIAPSKARISHDSYRLAESSGRMQVLSLAEFYAQMVSFDKYLEILIQRYESSDIARYYVDLGGRKPQFNAHLTCPH